MVKKIIVIALACVMLATVFAGCQATPAASSAPASSAAAPASSAAAPASSEAASAAPATADTLVGVSMPTKSLQRWNQDGDNMKAQLEKAGYQVDLEYAGDNDVATQVKQLENMITKGAKVLVIAAIDGDALKTVLDSAKQAKIVVFAYDRLIKGADYYATFDNYKVGVLQAQYVIKAMDLDNAKGPIATEVFGGSPDDNNAFKFNAGEMDTLKPYFDKGTLVVTSKQTAMDVIAIKAWTASTAQARMDNLLTAFYADKPVQLVISPNDSLAQGIVASLKAAGYSTEAGAKKPWPVITGQDCDKMNVSFLIAGTQTMSIFKDTRTLAAQTVKMVGQVLTGAKVDVNNTTDYEGVPSFLCDPVAVDKTNYKEMLFDSGYYKESDIPKS